MNYFSTFYRICTGPGVFVELYKRGAWKAFRDLLLTCVLGGMLYAAIQVALTHTLFTEGARKIDAEFGSLQAVGEALLPTRDAAVARTLTLTPAFSITYVPAPDPALGERLPDNGSYGLILTPKGSWAWMRQSADSVTAIPCSFAGWQRHIQTANAQQAIPIDKLGETIGSWEVPFPIPKDVQTMSAVNQVWVFQGMFGIFCWVGWFLSLLIQVLLFGGLFVLVFGLFGNSRTSLTRKEIWVTMIYAGFPAMLLGTLIQGFELGLSYNTVYVFGMIGYLLFILARLERELNPALRNQSNNRDSDDSDLDF